MLVAMFVDSIAVLVYMFLIATITGVVMLLGFKRSQVTLPDGNTTEGQDTIDIHTHQILFTGLWAVFGDVEFKSQLEANASYTRSAWLPVLLWIEAFFTTIFLVNLMIAKMTSTYEKIRSESLYYRALQRCEFVREYKDERGAPPPINLIAFIFRFFPRTTFIGRFFGESSESSKGFGVQMGRDATVRLQTRERVHAHTFDIHQMNEEAATMESRVGFINEDMTTVRHTARRCEALEAELFHLRATYDSVSHAVASRIDKLLEKQMTLEEELKKVNTTTK